MKWIHPGRAFAHSVPSAAKARVAVLLPLPLAGAYDYACPRPTDLTRGAFVRAPLGSRSLLGVVWGHGEGAVANEKLRVAARWSASRLPEGLCDFVDWVARYTLARPARCWRMPCA